MTSIRLPLGNVRGHMPHGGRLDHAVRQHGGRKSEWLDLSTGINPTSWPVPLLPQALWHRLPDDELFEAAIVAARTAWNVEPDAGIVVAAGSQQLIQTLPEMFPPQPVAILRTSYGEHSHWWAMHGHSTVLCDTLDAAQASARIVVVVNPNNPDGRIIPAPLLLALARRLAARGGLLVVDEAYADLGGTDELAGEAGRPGLFVMRSIGKFHGLAGIRVGFGLGPTTLLETLRHRLGPWAVSGPALQVAADALSDRTWRVRMQRVLRTRADDFVRMLDDFGLQSRGGTPLFQLLVDARVPVIQQSLLQARILARGFENEPTHLRFGIPGGARSLGRLRSALADAV